MSFLNYMRYENYISYVNYMSYINYRTYVFNPIQDRLFRGCSRMGGAFWPPLPKIRHTNPTIMKFGTVILYLRKNQKMYKSGDTPLGFCWHQHFFNLKSPNFATSRNPHTDWILIHNFYSFKLFSSL